jgi:hypothetical protein
MHASTSVANSHCLRVAAATAAMARLVDSLGDKPEAKPAHQAPTSTLALSSISTPAFILGHNCFVPNLHDQPGHLHVCTRSRCNQIQGEK